MGSAGVGEEGGQPLMTRFDAVGAVSRSLEKSSNLRAMRKLEDCRQPSDSLLSRTPTLCCRRHVNRPDCRWGHTDIPADGQTCGSTMAGTAPIETKSVDLVDCTGRSALLWCSLLQEEALPYASTFSGSTAQVRLIWDWRRLVTQKPVCALTKKQNTHHARLTCRRAGAVCWRVLWTARCGRWQMRKQSNSIIRISWSWAARRQLVVDQGQLWLRQKLGKMQT